MSKQTDGQLSDDTHERLKDLADHIRVAREEHIEAEELLTAKLALAEHQRSGDQTLSLDELDVVLGVPED